MPSPSRRQPAPSRRQPAPRPPLTGGRQERGQNFLADGSVATAMVDRIRRSPPRPVVDLGAGGGALTQALVRTGRPVTAVEIDPRRVRQLRQRFAGQAEVVRADMLAYDHGDGPYDIVSNVPFGITTPFLRHLMSRNGWRTAVVLLQWEVARKRAAVGRTTLLTASWWPWYEFALGSRVPASAFRPVPAVDGGVLAVERRPEPLVPVAERRAYQRFVRQIFGGHDLMRSLSASVPRGAVRRWMREERLPASVRPGGLTAAQWASLHRLVRDGS